MSKEFNISDIDNYNSNYNYEIYLYIIKAYYDVIVEFLETAKENIMVKDNKFNIFIIKRGIETIQNVFNLLFLYTKNINLTIYHCKKTFYYYVEFIGQIGYNNNSYLQLNSKDAILFVYKKTVFDINNEYKTNFTINETEKKFVEHINNYNIIINNFYFFILKKSNEENIELNIQKFNNLIKKILSEKKYNIKKNYILKKIIFFQKKIHKRSISINKYITIMELFIKKIKKKNIDDKQIIKKILNTDFSSNIEELTPLRFTNWLFFDN